MGLVCELVGVSLYMPTAELAEFVVNMIVW